MPELLVPVALILFASVAWLALLTLSSQRRRQTDQAQADRRAEAMLGDLLTEQEQLDLARHGYLDVTSPSKASRTYRIPRRRGQVALYEDGEPVALLCVQPVESVPDADVVLMHKILIEADEATYLSVANRFRVRRGGLAR
jgi:hypothetical protein